MTTKNKIKAAALHLFSKKNYEETTMGQIAEEVGIKTPSIYAFYKNKEALFLTVLHEVFSHHYEHIKYVSEGLISESTERKLYKILEGMHIYHLKEKEKTDFYRRFMLFPPNGMEDRVQEEFIKSDQFLSNVLDEIFLLGIESGEVKNIEVKRLTASYLCLMDGLFTQLFYYSREKEAIDWRLKTNWDIYWSGIASENLEV